MNIMSSLRYSRRYLDGKTLQHIQTKESEGIIENSLLIGTSKQSPICG